MKTTLQVWLNQCLAIVTQTKWCDTHIDDIEPTVTFQEWFEKAYELLIEGVAYLRSMSTNHTLVACISLRSDTIPFGLNFKSLAELQDEFNMTPPSLYVFYRGFEPWVQPTSNFVLINSEVVHMQSKEISLLYLEYREEDQLEFRRSLWMLPPDETALKR